MNSNIYSQQPEATINKIDQRSRARALKPALKSASKTIVSSSVTKSIVSNNLAYREGQFKVSKNIQEGKKTSLISYNKTGDHLQDATNYHLAKELYLDKHPELKMDKNQVQKISRAVYDNLPPARRAVIDANAARYEIIE